MTDYKKLEQQCMKDKVIKSENEKKYKQLFNNITDAVFLSKFDEVGIPGKIVEVNDVACRRLGYTREELLNMTVMDFNPEVSMEGFKRTKERMVERGQTIHFAYNRSKDGRMIPVEVNSVLITLNSEQYILSLARDISERKKAEELEKDMEIKSMQLKEAMEYEKLRTDFFANLSHELRTPINLISSTLQLCDFYMSNLKDQYKTNSVCSDKFRNHISIMKQNCNRLIRLINNIIDVTRIDNGFLQLNLKNYNIISVVEDITTSVAEYMNNMGISLLFDTEVEERIMACDSDKIERIMLNLISNAVKCTSAGGTIFINIFDKKDKIIISVKDTGIGISKEKQSLIFERFIQVDKSLTRAREGSGIGLSLVKSLVDMHNGTIRVVSELGQGSAFNIELPIRILEEDEESKDSPVLAAADNKEKVSIEFADIYL